MTWEELKSLQPGDVVVITKVDEHLNNGTTSKDYYAGEEMTFLIWNEWVDFLRHNNPNKPGQLGTIAHFAEGVCDYIEIRSELRDRKLTELGV